MRNQLFDRQGLAEQLASLLWSVTEKPHHLNLMGYTCMDQVSLHTYLFLCCPATLARKKVARVCQASFWPVKVF